MARLTLLAAFALVASLVIAPAAMAEQYDTPLEQQVEEELQEEVGTPVDVELSEQAEEQIQAAEQATGAPVQVEVAEPVEEQIEEMGPATVGIEKVQPSEEQKAQPPAAKGKAKAKEIPKTGGPALGSLLLPASILLVGSSIATYAILRRRR